MYAGASMPKRNITTIIVVLLLLLTNFLVSRPALAQQQLPDLVILKAWQSGSQISYTIENIGQGSAGNANAPVSYYNALYIDGKQVAEDHITAILAPGQQLDRFFNYQFQITSTPHTIKVVADWRKNIPESNEQNNYWEEVWVAEEQKLPDLIVEKIECGPNNKLSVTIKNIGSGAIPSGWKALADVYFDDAKKGFFDMTHATSVLNGGIDKPGGSSNYLIGWDITSPVTVVVIVDSSDEIEESNEKNNASKVNIEPQVTKLPDLAVSLIKEDSKNELIGYIIKNIGAGLAKGGHATALFVNGTQVAKDAINTDIKPGETYESWFSSYKLTKHDTVVVRVYADYYNQLEESNEDNNYLEKTFGVVVDTTPPVIISGPIVSKVTQTSAVISWETDEDSDSLVRYSAYAGKYDNVAEDVSLVKKHSLTLTKLDPATTYHFTVESKDASGNKVRSRDFSLETLSPTDKEKPSLSLKLPDFISGQAVINVDVKDNIGVDRVVFYLDGKPVFTDFTAPFEWRCDSRTLNEGGHSFGASAFDAAGNSVDVTRDGTVQNHFLPSQSPVKVTIVNPVASSKHFGVVEIRATITQEKDADIIHTEVKIDGNIVHQVNYPTVNPLSPRLVKPGASERVLTVRYMWDTSTLAENTEHVIEVLARDEFDNVGQAGIRVIRTGEPTAVTSWTANPPVIIPFSLERTVTPHGNYFSVRLTVHNLGTGSGSQATNVIIRDTSRGFQAAQFGHLPVYDYLTAEVTVEKTAESLPPGGSIDYLYFIVPVLFDPMLEDYTIGTRTIIEYDDASGNHVTQEYDSPYIPGDYISAPYPLIPEEIGNAFRTADYLIVTDPRRLFRSSDNDSVNELLSTMAELAIEKNGVLGYCGTGAIWTTAQRLRNNFRPDGVWGNRLSSDSTFNGYLLLVGETDIIPAWHLPCPGFFESDTGGYIDISDYPYADICGDIRPELRVGRIIGRDAAELAKPIWSSLTVSEGRADYDGSDVLLVTGPEDTWESSVRSAERGRITLAGKDVTLSVSVVHTEYYTTKHDMLAEALRIKGADHGGANYSPNPPLDTFDTGQLAVWLLDSEDVYWTSWAITYQHFTDTEGRDHLWAPAYFTDYNIDDALRIAERIQAERRDRGGSYGWTYTYLNTGTEVLQRRAQEVKAQVSNKDIILFLGHGGAGSWCSVLDDWATSDCPVEPISFGSSYPVVIAFSCLTGNYVDVPGQSFARACLRNGAAVYIGSTEVSYTADNEEATRETFWRSWTKNTRIGDALFDFRNRMIREGDWWRYLVYEYNLYGDPKFGGGS
jgi:hypothetical protein